MVGGGNMDGIYTSLAANTITFAPGTYMITGRAVGWGIGKSQVRLRNTTSNSTLMVGIPVNIATGGADIIQIYSEVSTISSFSSTAAVQLQHNCRVTVANNGMGSTGAFTGREMEVYATVDIFKM
jgi:hypothetical protein